MPGHFQTTSLSNWDGIASLRQGGREGQERDEGMEEFRRKADVYMDVDLDGDIPGLGQIRAHEDEEQVPGLNLSKSRTPSRPRRPPPPPLASFSLASHFSSFMLSSIDRDGLPSYIDSRPKSTESYRHAPSTSRSENTNDTVREGASSTSITSGCPRPPKPLLGTVPGSSTISPRQRLPSAEQRISNRSSDDMKSRIPSKPGRRAEPGPLSHRAKDNVDSLFTPPKGEDMPLFTPPRSPLPSLSSPEPVARWVQTPEPDDDVAMVQVVKAKANKKKTLQVCVAVPRLSKAERKTYNKEDEETLGSRVLIPVRRSESSAPRASSSAVVQRPSSSYAVAVQRSSSAAPRKQSFLSSVQRSSSSSSRYRPSSSSRPAPSLPASYRYPQRKAKQKALMDIKEHQSMTNAFRLNEFYELDHDAVVEVEERVLHLPSKGEDGPPKSKVYVASTSKAFQVNSASRAAPVSGDLLATYNRALGAGSARKDKAKVVADKGKHKDKSVVDKGKGKTRAVDDDEVATVPYNSDASGPALLMLEGHYGAVAAALLAEPGGLEQHLASYDLYPRPAPLPEYEAPRFSTVNWEQYPPPPMLTFTQKAVETTKMLEAGEALAIKNFQETGLHVNASPAYLQNIDELARRPDSWVYQLSYEYRKAQKDSRENEQEDNDAQMDVEDYSEQIVEQEEEERWSPVKSRKRRYVKESDDEDQDSRPPPRRPKR